MKSWALSTNKLLLEVSKFFPVAKRQELVACGIWTLLEHSPGFPYNPHCKKKTELNRRLNETKSLYMLLNSTV